MRPIDYFRHKAERAETNPENIEITPLPPTMEKEIYQKAKEHLLGFWSYYYDRKKQAEDGIGYELNKDEDRESEVAELFKEYNKDNSADLSAIPEAARLMDPDLFKMLAVTGRDTDLSFIDDLERRYGEVPALKLAVRLVAHTKGLWRAFERIHEEHPEDLSAEDLRRLRENALEMARYRVPATHVTRDEESAGGIDLHGFIEKSDWREKDTKDYEGNGVYVGIFGAYRNWSPGGKLYEFQLPLKDAFPILVGNDDKFAMANTLTEYIRVQDLGKGQALGVHQWFVRSDQAWMDDERRLLPWQKRILSELYGKEFGIHKDSDGADVAVIDTTDPPIVLATVGKYLGLYRCMSESDWVKLPESEKSDG